MNIGWMFNIWTLIILTSEKKAFILCSIGAYEEVCFQIVLIAVHSQQLTVITIKYLIVT
jgi:hypothetical protein